MYKNCFFFFFFIIITSLPIYTPSFQYDLIIFTIKRLMQVPAAGCMCYRKRSEICDLKKDSLFMMN
jgi:hypothetical protein